MCAVTKVHIRKALVFVGLGIAALFSLGASASCPWGGASIPNAFRSPVVFQTAGNMMLGNKRWYDDSRYQEGSYMGMSTTTLTARVCTNLRELRGQQVDVVFTPPLSAIKIGAGYRIPTNAAGVAIDIEFPSGVPRTGGILVSSSEGRVTSGGLLSEFSSKFAPVQVKISVVKTGKFANVPNGSPAAEIRVDGGLGWFRYYGRTDGSVAASDDQLLMPERYGVGSGAGMYVGYASAPSCEIVGLGTVSLTNGTPTVIALDSVSTLDFKGVGAISKSAKSQPFRFSCRGIVGDTRPAISFSATFPLNGGSNGVGMPSADSDIGIQILLNDIAVVFDQNSAALVWAAGTPASPVDGGNYGPLPAQGLICKTDCDVDMSGPNWKSGGATSGVNDGTDASVTFKYYQTTGETPAPSAFSVPFTVTLDLL